MNKPSANLFNWKIYRETLGLNPYIYKNKERCKSHFEFCKKDIKNLPNVLLSVLDLNPIFNNNKYRIDNPHLNYLNDIDLEYHYYKNFNFNQNFIGITLMGGLGNRLFQICTAYAISKKYNRPLAFSINDDNKHSKIDYFSNIFRNFPITKAIFKKTFNEPGEKCLQYINIPIENDRFTLLGYFQNEKYFMDYRNELLELMAIEPDREMKILEKYPDIRERYFIHIRRGDYVNNELHYINLSNYYKNCINYIKSIDSQAKFYILSNDTNYCKTLNWENSEIINSDEIDGLYIMSLCRKGGICANSSYSWWGGWLNNNESKIVIFPNKWFNNNWDVEIGFKGAYICDINSELSIPLQI